VDVPRDVVEALGAYAGEGLDGGTA
jgi:hypothetical protein